MNKVIKECRLCGSVGPHRAMRIREMMFGSKEIFEYYTCAVCDSLQIVDMPDSEELARHYPSGYYSYNAPARPKLKQWLMVQQDRFELQMGDRLFGPLLARLLPERVVRPRKGDAVRMLGELALGPDARILDVGCGGGALLDRLARVGFKNLAGADPFITADGVTPLGVPLMKRYLSEVDGEFDLIMFNHSLEHVPDPVATLKAAYEKLAPGGICLARLPTTSSEAWNIYQADWVQIDAPRHIVIPSRYGMAMAADMVGLRVEKTLDDSTYFQFIASEAYRHDIALTDPKVFWKMLRIVGPKRIRDWKKSSESLNRQGLGDQAGFVLRVKDTE